MAQVIHVIKRTGTRFEFRFVDHATPQQILEELQNAKARFGFNEKTTKPDPNHPGQLPTDFANASSGFAYDNPETVVAILKTDAQGNVEVDDRGCPVELKRLKGPPAAAPANPQN